MRPPGEDSILVVDDDADTRDALRELLETEGYAVVEAANGRAALQRLRGGLRPRAILLDLMMPVLDGWDFRSQQLADPALKDVPVVIMTAAGFSADTVRAQLGGIDFVSKPPPPDQLLATLRNLPPAADR